MKNHWYRVKPKEEYTYYRWYWLFVVVVAITTTALSIDLFRTYSLVAFIISSIGLTITLFAHAMWIKKRRSTSRCIDYVIKRNDLYQSYFDDKNREIYEFYPEVWFQRVEEENTLYIRFRLDGSSIGEKLLSLQSPLANKFKTVCIGKLESAGYITYAFELESVSRLVIETPAELSVTYDDSIIPITKYINWNWKSTFHLLLTGDTGSGKSYFCMYLMACMLKQGVRIIYCDCKGDPDLRFFMKHNPGIRYCKEVNEIAKAVREVTEEMELRGNDLEKMGLEEADFNPIYIFFDELANFSLVAKERTYNETIERISSMVLTGRAKRIGVALISQRSDTKYFGGGIIRDNLGCRVAMGNMFDTGYTMAFGENFQNLKNPSPMKGSGLIYRKDIDTIPRPFITPYVDKNVLVNL